MKPYEYADKDGDKLFISSYQAGESLVQVEQDGGDWGIRVQNADAPTVAAELLKAAGHEIVFVELPTLTVEEFPDGDLRCGLTDTVNSTTSDWAWARAVELLAIAEHLKGKESQETEATIKLHERRNAIAREIMRNDDNLPVTDYASLTWYAQKAIDRIIELEDGK